MTKLDFKNAFEAFCNDVNDVDENSFEITGSEFPLKSLIAPNAHFIQFSTFIQLAGQGFSPGSPKKFYPFLDALNQTTNIAKLTAENCSDGTWTVLAKAMIVSGSESAEYTQEQLSNLITLWHQDIAKVIAAKGPYEITGMLVG